MDPDAFTVGLYKWDPRGVVAPPPQPPPSNRLFEAIMTPTPMSYTIRPREYQQQQQIITGGIEDFFQAYGIRYYTAAKIAELGFTVSTLLDMKDEELDDMMNSIYHIFRWDLLVGERYGIKAAVRAERRRLEDDESRRRHLLTSETTTNPIDALSQEGLSEEPVQQEKEAAGSGGGGAWEVVLKEKKKIMKKKKQQRRRKQIEQGVADPEEDDDDDDEEEEDNNGGGGGGIERQREHPFIVTEPGEVARGKKNGLDYLFHLYEQCRDFLIQVQNIAKERGEKCPTKVTNQVFRFAKKAGASYINKPKMRHYVHCYAFHCLDEEASNALRKGFKERGENVGAWRQACYEPLVAMAARQGWDIDGIFNAHPRLSIWYVPTKLRQLCHAQRRTTTTNTTTVTTSSSVAALGAVTGPGHVF
uniref:Floricaula/leafy-like transcription factor n=1 Tax=Eschscholzia californica subsp. californica TaxID=222997 RepID=Q84NB8_ESCCA|nr:floricaula-like protein [Eschscholzia californica subsp. californica]